MRIRELAGVGLGVLTFACTESQTLPSAPSPVGPSVPVVTAGDAFPDDDEGTLIAESVVSDGAHVPQHAIEALVTEAVLLSPDLAPGWKPRPGGGTPRLPNPWLPRPRIRIITLPRRPTPNPYEQCRRRYETHCKQGGPPDYRWVCHTFCYKSCK